MKVTVDQGFFDAHTAAFSVPPRLILEPETDQDQAKLEKILKRYEVDGFGRDPQTLEPLHVIFNLTPKNPAEAAHD
jgi:hypothetical protein